MKKLLLTSLTMFLISGCYEKAENSYTFKWATLNSRTVESELLKIAKRQNPYPSEINVDIDKLKKDTRNLSGQISSLTKIAKSKCIKDATPKEQPKTQIRVQPRAIPSFRSNSNYDKVCIEKINTDPLISDIKEKKEKLDTISKLRSKHDIKVREASKDHVDILTREYSDSKFELVLKDDRNNILFNKSGVSIDITEAILNEIKLNEPKITINQV